MPRRRNNRQYQQGQHRRQALNPQDDQQGSNLDGDQRNQYAGRPLSSRGGGNQHDGRRGRHAQAPQQPRHHGQHPTFPPRGRKRTHSEFRSMQSSSSFSSSEPPSAAFSRPDTPVPSTIPTHRACRFFARGHCREGDKCRFSHAATDDDDADTSGPPRKRPRDLDLALTRRRFELQPSTPSQHECNFWRRGVPHDEEKCQYAHYPVEHPVLWRRPSVIFCPFFAAHHSCPAGKGCPYSHSPIFTPMTGVEATGPALEIKREFASIGMPQGPVFEVKPLEDIFASVM